MNLSAEEIQEIRELRYGDGLTREATAALVGRSPWTVGRYAPGRPGKVDNAALREAFERSGLTVAEVARRMNWWWVRNDGHLNADGSRVKRTLGLLDDLNRCGRSRRRLIDAETAGLLAEAIGVMSWEVGA